MLAIFNVADFWVDNGWWLLAVFFVLGFGFGGVVLGASPEARAGP